MNPYPVKEQPNRGIDPEKTAEGMRQKCSSHTAETWRRDKKTRRELPTVLPILEGVHHLSTPRKSQKREISR